MPPPSPSASRRRLLAAAALAAAPLARARAAAPFPQRAVRIVVPYSVGIGPDVVARALGQGLAQRWGRPVVIDNRPGASGIVAFNELRNVAADGHTLFVGDSGSLAVNPLIHASLPYSVERDVAPLTTLFRATFAIQVGARSRYRTLAELLAQARRAPLSVSYASFGNGHPSHVAVESFARAAGVQFLHVPFREGGAQMSAVANGEVDFVTLSMYSVAPLVQAGKLRALAVAARQRLPGHPQIPTLAEAGAPMVEMRPWAALVARAGTPAPLLAQLERDVVDTLTSAEVRGRVEGAGFEVFPGAPAQLRALIESDSAEYAVLVREGRVLKA